MSEYIEGLKTSIMLRVSGCRHEMMRILIDMFGMEIAKDKVMDIYRPHDDPDEDDALDIEIEDLDYLTEYLSKFKESTLTLFITTKSPVFNINVQVASDHVQDIHTSGQVEHEKINADLQGRIEKAINNLQGVKNEKE